MRPALGVCRAAVAAANVRAPCGKLGAQTFITRWNTPVRHEKVSQVWKEWDDARLMIFRAQLASGNQDASDFKVHVFKSYFASFADAHPAVGEKLHHRHRAGRKRPTELHEAFSPMTEIRHDLGVR